MIGRYLLEIGLEGHPRFGDRTRIVVREGMGEGFGVNLGGIGPWNTRLHRESV